MANHRVLVSLFNLRYKRLLLPIALFALLVSENTRAVTVETLADSFWAVSTYVAFTLAIYHWVSRWLDGAHALVSAYHRSRNLQVVIAALLVLCQVAEGRLLSLRNLSAAKWVLELWSRY